MPSTVFGSKRCCSWTLISFDLQRGFQAAEIWFTSLPDVPSVPGFFVMELVQSARNNRELTESLRMVRALPVIWPEVGECESALLLFTRYHLSHSLGLIDSLIAACAIEHDADLCTFNTKHFGAVPGLRTRQPYSKP